MVPSDQLPKNYDFAEVEERWRKTWRDEDHYFDKNSKKPQFVIDTPPPYPTGNFHIGNALNWCYIDFFARYKRMKGFNVMFPQGWDCHGLPTEVKVEEINNITKNDVSREEFRKMCRDLPIKNIAAMRLTLRKMAFSTDWSNEYITMMPKYYSKTQLSFLRMLASGYIYQSEHPVNYCTRCETAIAFAEVAYEDRETTLNYFDFDGVEIATTRPELLAACVAVAVHPDDERYHKLKGKSMKVPLFGHDVPVVQDEAVDPAFGSGAVMICTFGDKQDVHWWKQHNLALRKAIDRQGKMTDIAGKYKGLNTTECRKAILADMKATEYPETAGETRPARGHLLALQDPHRDPLRAAVVREDQAGRDPEGSPPDHLVSRAHAPADGELGRADGMGLVHLPAADLCHPDPGLVLHEMRRDGDSR